MKIESPGDLVYWTYHMMDWEQTEETPSDQTCVQCGGRMQRIGPVSDPKGRSYDGLVCHKCKRVIWVRAS